VIHELIAILLAVYGACRLVLDLIDTLWPVR
jgi:hypothetical protein